jgi:hypothetical protein
VSTERWRDPAWRQQAEGWIDDQLHQAGARRTGEVTYQWVRPWAVAAHLPTTAGRVWFKAGAPSTAYEVGLVQLLRRVAPARLLEPIALDPARGWSLHPDGGPTLRDVLADHPEERLSRWERVLPEHAELQRAATALTPELLLAGVPDLRPSTVPEVAERLVGSLADPALREQAQQLLPRLAAASTELAGSAVPATAQHDDLHDANVLVADGYRYVDWGDASVGHPFGVFLVLRRSIAHWAGISEDDPALTRLADVYLEVFSDVAPAASLRRELALAEYVGGVARADSWRRALADATAAEVAALEDPVAGWLAELVETPGP